MSVFNIHNLSVSFSNNSETKLVLNNLSLSFGSKQLISIVGKSGCGKSTFLNILLGIEKPTSGTVKFCGHDISKLKDKGLSFYRSDCVAMVFQHYNLFDNLSVIENIALPMLIKGIKKKEARSKAIYLLNKFSLTNLANQKVAKLSGGEKQRVAIMRSLINNPKVILCDEPTGALDEDNAILVMDLFKQISKERTVIVVSHNQELVDAYSDRKIVLQDGKIIKDSQKDIYSRDIDIISFQRKKHTSWNNIFVRKGLKENRGKNVLSLLASSFGFLAIMLSFGFSNGSKESQTNALNKNLDICFSKVSYKTYYEIENSPLSYEKSVRPNFEQIDSELKDINLLIFKDNFSYAFHQYPDAVFQEKQVPDFEAIPLIFEEEESNDGIIVNQEFANYFNCNIIGEELVINNASSYSFYTGDSGEPFIKDEINCSVLFKIKEVVKEFSFLNTPKIYYSYQYVLNNLNQIRLDNISKYKKEFTSPIDFIEQANCDEVYSSYSLFAFLKTKENIADFFEVINDLRTRECNLQIDSTPYEVRNAYSSFVSSFSNALFAFVFIVLFGVNTIIGMLSLSNFIEHKKEAAILTCLGSPYSMVTSIYQKQNMLLIIVSFCISLALLYPLQSLLNSIIMASFNLENLINTPIFNMYGVYFLLPLAVLLVALIVASLFLRVPMFFYRKISLTNELRDE